MSDRKKFLKAKKKTNANMDLLPQVKRDEKLTVKRQKNYCGNLEENHIKYDIMTLTMELDTECNVQVFFAVRMATKLVERSYWRVARDKLSLVVTMCSNDMCHDMCHVDS